MIQCPDCNHANGDDARFCERCGVGLSSVCSACGTKNNPEASFCRGCGNDLAVPKPGTTQSLPASFGGGRYVVQRLLGEGARKLVYLAKDTLLDRGVAIAKIKGEGLDEAGRTRIKRETQAMARLGDHPNIVTIHDVLEESGTIYIVSQFMAGGSIEDVLKEAPDHRLGVEDSLKAGREIASALAHAHDRGIVHRDLKPANVWLSQEGNAKLGDFGLAVAIDQSRITTEGMIVGTVAYIAPEQALGQPPDARSDLYALGAMLYEMLAGRLPFLGDDAVGVISQHISTPPVRLSWHNPDVPPAVEDLVLRLLSKEPQDRPSSAAEVADAIDALASRPGELAERVVRDDANPLDRLAAGVFVGRDAEMRDLKSSVDAALSGQALLLMLVGEPGIGKTRLTEEVSTYARLRGAQVLLGRCYEGEGAPAYWPWIQVVRSYVHEKTPETLISEMGSGAANIAQMVSEVRERLPGLPEPPVLDPDESRFRLFDAVANFLRNASKSQPLVIVLDDLHWADKPSLLLMQFLARELRGTRVLGIGTYRDVELGRHHPLAQTLAELAGENVVRRVLLRGLEEHDVARFVELNSGVVPEETLVKTIHRETEGNPFFLAETVRLLVSEGKLTKGAASSSSWSVTIPQGVREVVGRRLNRLSENANSVLSFASVIGRDFSLNVLQRASELDKELVLDGLEEALEARVITEEEGIGRYRFSHALVRETLYDDLSTTRRIKMHRSLGRILESMYSTDLDRHLPELAHHFFESAAAGEVDKAIEYLRAAGERASLMTAYEEASEHYDKALQVYELKDPPDDHLLCDLVLGLARAQTNSGETQGARDSFDRAAKLAVKLDDPARMAQAALGAGEVWVSAGWFEEGLITLLEKALAMQPQEDSSDRALLLGRLGEALRFTDRKDEEVVLSAEAVDMARRVGGGYVLTQTLFWRIVATGKPEDHDLRKQMAKELVAAAAETQDVKRELLGHRVSMHAACEEGDLAAVAAHLDQYEQISTRIRLPLFTWFNPLLRAGQALQAGRFEEADTLLEEARLLGEAAHEPNLGSFLWVSLVTLRRYQGRIDDFLDFVSVNPAFSRMMWTMTADVMLEVLQGDREAGKRRFEELAADDFASIPQDWPKLWGLCDLAEAAAELEHPAGETLYELLEPYKHLYVTGFPAYCRGPVPHHLGILASSMGRQKEAIAHFETATKMMEGVDSPPVQAQIEADHAKSLLATGDPADREAGLAMANSALKTSRELGMRGLVEKLVGLKLEMQGSLSHSTTSSIHVVAAEVEGERPDLRSHASPNGTVTLLFSDIEGSTSLNESLGDERWFEILGMHNDIIRKELARHQGYEVKNNGDGFMIAFSSARLALQCAIHIQRALDDYNARDPEVPIKVRMGLHSGETIRDAGDFFGRHVNLAARVANEALGGQILVSSLTRELASGSAEFRFIASREVSLKGLAEPQWISELLWNPQSD